MGYITEYSLTLGKNKCIKIDEHLSDDNKVFNYAVELKDKSCSIAVSLTQEQLESLAEGLLLILGMTAVRIR